MKRFLKFAVLDKKRRNGDLEVLSKKMLKGNGVPTTTYAEGFRRPPTALVLFDFRIGKG